MLDIGLKSVKKIYKNLNTDDLIDMAIKNEGAKVSSTGALIIDTGKFTGRSPKDKYFVDKSPSTNHIAWGDVNKPISQDIFDELLINSKNQLENKSLFVTDLYCGASYDSRIKVRFITELAWQAHFVKNMFINPKEDELENFKPDFTVYNSCKTTNKNWQKHGLNSPVYVAFDIENAICVIGGTWYAGEMKKGIFSIMNYHLPLHGKMAMHCSANVGSSGDVALFFGLSGTGKTTLSTDEKRALIGDDEHGWDENGVFNFEGGCYAKVVNLNKKSEPEIYDAIKKGAILENIVSDEAGVVDFDDTSKTQNTRVSYPINHIHNIQKGSLAGHPSNIIFLSADAFGVLPPVSKLTKEQAIYYFLSGYTAKVAGTELGVDEPTATFSACFGEAFLPLHPTFYANLLGKMIEKHQVDIYLVNTGWTGGAYGVGKRMSIKNTRACIDAILDGSIKQSKFEKTDIFNLSIPTTLKGVDTHVLNPAECWNDRKSYDTQALKLAKMYIENFKKYSGGEFDFSSAGPKI